MQDYFYAFIIFIVIVVVGLAITLLGDLLRQKPRGKKVLDISKIGITHIDKMQGRDFEQYIHVLLTALGYKKVHLTPETNDYGADIVFYDTKRNRTVIQAKRYTTRDKNAVSLDAVQQIYTSMKYYNAKKALCISSTNYTKNCESLARITGVRLINRDELKEIIKLFKSNLHIQARNIIEKENNSKSNHSFDENKLESIKKGKTKITSGEYYYLLPTERNKKNA